MFLQLFILSVVIIGIAFSGFAIKMFFVKGSMFKKQCTSSIKDPKTGRHLGCVSGGACHNPVMDEVNYQKKSPISKTNLQKMIKSATFE